MKFMTRRKSLTYCCAIAVLSISLFVILPNRSFALTEYPDGYKHSDIDKAYAEAILEAEINTESSRTYREIPYRYRCEFSCPNDPSKSCEKIYSRIDSYLWKDEHMYFEALENSTDLLLTNKYFPHENHYDLPEKIAVIVVHFEKTTDKFTETCAGPACSWISEQKKGQCRATSIVIPFE